MSFKIGSQKKPRDKKRREPITYYELVELENQRNNPPPPVIKLPRQFPIAPDGFIPNSVVQKFFELFEQEEVVPPTIWKLNWKPTDIIEETASARGSPERQVLEYDWTDEEEDLLETDEAGHELNEDDETAPEKMFSDLVNRMRECDWFDVSNENLNTGYLIRYLFGKLIERNTENHLDITNFITEINEKFKISQDSKDWLIVQLEDELDATDEEIIANNLKLISVFNIETYKIDVGLIDIMKKFENKMEEAQKILMDITNTNEEQIEFVLENIKKIYNSKYKKEEADFKILSYVEDIEAEIAETNEINNEANDVTKNNEIFKTILKEDWIATNIKESFKSLEDFLEYFLKYLKTAKSKIFYEKVANFLNSLYQEFKLEKSDWEVRIIDHFVNNNTDPKVPEVLRIIDLDNLGRYYHCLTDTKQKHQILIELLRSACFEKNRKQVMKLTDTMLRELTNFSDEFMTNLMNFYSSKKFNAVTILSWTETLDFLKNKPDITTDEILAIKELDPSILDVKVEVEAPSKPTKHGKGKKGKHKSKKDKQKGKKEKKGSKDKTDKNAISDNTKQKDQSKIIDNADEQNFEDDTIRSNKGTGSPCNFSTTMNTNDFNSFQQSTNNKSYKNYEEDEHLNAFIRENSMETSEMISVHSKKTLPSLTKKSAEIFLPSSTESVKFYKTRNEQVFKDSFKIGSADPDSLDANHTLAPKSSIQQINNDFINQNVSHSTGASTSKQTEDLTDQYLSGITKRVVFFENRYKLSETITNLKAFSINEKCHLIDQNEINGIDDHNFRFESFRQNRRSREDEYSKLLQCLIIRGLDLHRHYERLMQRPPEKTNDTSADQNLQFYNDFLVVHPYNLKNMSGKHRSYIENKRNIYSNLQMNMYMTEQERELFNNEVKIPHRKPYRTNPLGGPRHVNNKNNHEAKINNLELNHLFLINKLLISYGAQNLKKFYTSINNDFKSYLQRLHSRIPHRIVPLIWNDPVIQKIAMIISSTKQLQGTHDIPRKLESPGLYELKSKLNVKTRPSSGNYVRSKAHDFPQKYNLVSGYNIEDPHQEMVYPARTTNGPHIGTNTLPKDQFEYWPIFKQEDTNRNKTTKRKLYSHLVNMKNEYVKLQWRYMLQDEKYRRNKSYLPPLSLKATLNSQSENQRID